MLNLLNYTEDLLARHIWRDKLSIIIYGAGMIGKIIIPSFLKKNNLLDFLKCYIDADECKQQEKIQVDCKAYDIFSPDYLNNISKNSILFITNSNYAAVLNMLDGIDNLNGMDAVIIPVLQILGLKQDEEKYELINYELEKIPKVINYCWFSGKEMPQYLVKCIESWKRKCPDYEVKRWDESNYDINKNKYMSDAYGEKKWGFVPDYARLDILYNYGGFYLDTDVELLESLDKFREQGAFCGVEKWGNINMGGCSGAVPGHPMIKKLLDYRENIPFKLDNGRLNLETCGIYETTPMILEGMRVDNSIQRIHGMTVFSSDFFHPYDYMSEQTIITSNTVSIHHFNGGWLDDNLKQMRKKTAEQYISILKRMECTGKE